MIAAGIDGDLLDVDLREIVVGEEAAFVDVNRLVFLGAAEREIEVLELEPELAVALGVSLPARKRPRCGAVFGGKNRPMSIGLVMSTAPSRATASAGTSADHHFARFLAAADERLRPIDRALLVDEIDVAVDLGEREPHRLFDLGERDVEVEAFEIERRPSDCAMNGPDSLIVPFRLSPPIVDLMQVRSVGPKFFTASWRSHLPSYGRSHHSSELPVR